jgi:hypothetical protein
VASSGAEHMPGKLEPVQATQQAPAHKKSKRRCPHALQRQAEERQAALQQQQEEEKAMQERKACCRHLPCQLFLCDSVTIMCTAAYHLVCNCTLMVVQFCAVAHRQAL